WARVPLDIVYPAREWGVPVHDDRRLFEFLVLDGAQAGLSWITILRKRAAYRRAFADFDIKQVAAFGARDPRRRARRDRSLTHGQRGAARARFSFRRPDDRLRVHASGGDGERPPRFLLS